MTILKTLNVCINRPNATISGQTTLSTDRWHSYARAFIGILTTGIAVWLLPAQSADIRTAAAAQTQNSVAFHLRGERTELSGTTDGSTVTPTIGLKGTLRVDGSGGVRFPLATVGTGVYFVSCCDKTDNAYYEFDGNTIGQIFDTESGEIKFNLKSRRTWAQRKTTTYRTVFSVQDKPGNYLFSFVVGNTAGRLSLAYRLGSTAATHYYIPAGQEDAVFGNADTLSVRLVWSNNQQSIYLNNQLKQTTGFTPAAAAWSAASVFTFGANGAQPMGVYNSCDDVIDEFVVSNSAVLAPDTTPPTVPTNVKAIAISSSRINLTWTPATDNVGVARYRIRRKGLQIGTAAGSSYVDAQGSPATTYSYTIAAIDEAGNVSAESAAVTSTTLPATSSPPQSYPATSVNVASNTWVRVTPTYTGAPNGGQIWPMSWNSMGVYDPVTRRTLSYDRWRDSVRGQSIYANALLAYDPAQNVVEVVKVANWYVNQKANGGYTTEALPANATEPTPVDRHVFGGLALDPTTNHVYMVNGLNQSSSISPTDTWKLNLAAKKWTKVADSTTVHPPNDGGKFSSLVYDPSTGKLVQFLVRGGNGTQTWLLDPATGVWSALPQDATSTPVNISGAGVAYDSKRNRILAYGGGASYWITGLRLWAYSVSTNKWTRLADAPTAASAPEFAYDSVHDVFLAVVGTDTLIYNPNTDKWDRIPTPASMARGKVMTFQNLTYNPAHDVFVFQGGTFDNPLWYLFRYNPATLPVLPTDNQAPSIPTGLTATGLSSSSIKLSWTASTDNIGVAGYRIYNNGSLRGTSTTTSYTETGLLPSMSYSFTVAAYDATGNITPQSPGVSGRTLASSPDTAQPVISAVTAMQITSSRAVISWTTSEAANGQVDYGTTTAYGSVTPLVTALTTSHTVTITGLSASKTYNYRVRSKDAAGNTAVSANATFTTAAAGSTSDTQAPSTPAGLKATVISSSQINLTWTVSSDNVGVTSYVVYRNGTAVATKATASHNETGLAAATTYSYTVAAQDAAGNRSAQSTAISAKTLAATTANKKPTGMFEGVDSTGRVYGWASDPDDLSKPVTVRIYIDANAGQAGASPVEIVASAFTADTGNHGFSYSIPAAYRDGKAHSVWVWAGDLTDTTGASDVQLTGSPKTFTLSSGPPPPPPAPGTVNVPLIIQESIYPGVSGITRSQDPVTVGIPLADAAAVTSESQLSLAGAAVAQFRILGRWPSGNAKWVLVDTLADVNAGGLNTSTALIRGGGEFGGSPLATDSGSTITINTGQAQFTIRKANFNGIDKAIVNGKTLVAAGTSQGLVVTGPAPGQTTCGTCTTVYTSANDAQSTAVIEENGPVRAVVKATGHHKTATGASYMAFTVRLTFYKGRTQVKLTSSLQNADYGPSNSVASAYKGFESYDLQITNALGGTRTFSFGTHGSPLTGTMAGTDSAYLYQGSSDSLKHQHWCGFGCVPFSSDKNYEVVKNGSVLLTGLTTAGNKQYPQGWADLRDSTGAGIGVGVYQLSAHWPKSLEFHNGGSEIRIGIWPKQNSIPYYQSWPQYSIHDLYLNFHDKPVAAPADDFFKFQHYLVARANREHYNATNVFPYPLIDPVEEDEFYKNVSMTANPATIAANRACCIDDHGTTNSFFPQAAFRFFGWRSAGGGGMGNQAEFRWSFLMNFLARGYTGRYVLASHFYRFQAEQAFPRSDGFRWRDRPFTELDAFGFPGRVVSANSDFAHRSWMDQEHAHWYGMIDYYFMTGDEGIHDAILDGPKDRYMNPGSTVNNPLMNASSGLFNTRAVGAQLMSTARLYEFLKATGDPDAEAVLTIGTRTYAMQVKPELCVSGFPNGCSAGALDSLNGGGVDSGTRGVSRTRGLHWGPAGRSGHFCDVPHQYRVNSVLQNSILIQGVWEFMLAKGPAWDGYEDAIDLAYGIGQWALTEAYQDDGSGRWDVNGYRFGVGLDVASACDVNYKPYVGATVWFPFFIQHEVKGVVDWETKFKTVLRKNMASLGIGSTDFGTFQTVAVIDKLKRPGTTTLVDIPATVTSLGAGSYRLSWRVPAGAKSYRIKWGTKRIVDWVGFDSGTNLFIGDPNTTMPWFAANNVENEPAPAAAGTVQTFTLTGLPASLPAGAFSVKAYVSQ